MKPKIAIESGVYLISTLSPSPDWGVGIELALSAIVRARAKGVLEVEQS